jgi:3-dehydroquinate dehydratase-2
VAKLLLINGPNLNLLGQREPEKYGHSTLAELDNRAAQHAAKLGHQLRCFQSNAEHALIERIHAAKSEDIGFIVINPGAFTHTSIALRDAFLAVAIPFIEVHLTNVYAREPFRHHSYLSDCAVGVISGLGADGYEFAISAAAARLAGHS